MKRPAELLRIRYESGKWYAVAFDTKGAEISRSPGGTEIEAEQYLKNKREFGAWLKS